MAEGEDEIETLTLELTPQMAEALEQLLQTGLFGFNVGDVADRLLCAAVLQRAEEGWLVFPWSKRLGKPR